MTNRVHRSARRAALVATATSVAAISAAGLAEQVSAADPSSPSSPPAATIDCDGIVAAIESNAFVTFAGELDDAAVHHDGPLTVFVPTDEAMADIPDNVFAALAADRALAVALVDAHVVVGEQLALDDVVAAGEVATSGDPLAVAENDGVVTIDDDATVVCPDVTVDGEPELTIHVIDAVLRPAAPDGGVPGSSVPGSSVPGSSVPGSSVPGVSEPATMFDADQEAAATAWETVVDSSLTFDEQAPYLEDADALQPMVAAYPAAAEVVGGISAEVTAVEIDGDTATLQYLLFFDGVEAPYGEQEATVIAVDGDWVVSVEQYCEFQSLARNREPCPA